MLGPVVATFGMAVYRFAFRPGPLIVPWGLLLAVLGGVAFVVLLREFGRNAGIAGAVGWVAGEAGSLAWHPGGDFLLASDWLGYSMMVLGTAGVMVAGTWGRRR